MKITLALPINPEKSFLILVGIASLLLIIDQLFFCCGFVSEPGLRVLLDITLEGNIPTWFSSTQFLLLAMICFGLTRTLGFSADSTKKSWFILSGFFLYLAIDDAARVHERVAHALTEWILTLHSDSLLGKVLGHFPSYTWLILLLPILGAIGLFIFWFLYRMLKPHRLHRLLFISMAGFMLSVLLDFIDGNAVLLNYLTHHTFYSFEQVRHSFRAYEEFIEMISTSVLVFALLKYWVIHDQK